jgi:hypothetical protein
MKFHRLSVEQDNGTSIPSRPWVRLQVQGSEDRPGGLVKRPGVETDFKIPAIVPVAVGGWCYLFCFGEWNDGWFLLHRR